MNDTFINSIGKLMGLRYKSHPWHGVEIGENAPEVVMCFIEIVPSDTVKYEIDKVSGFLKIDRPQKYSNTVPAPYGFLPQTYSGERVAQLCNERTGRTDISGDCDPLDICILTEKDLIHGDIIAQVRPIGGFRLIDGNEADDKLIAVLKDDAVYGDYRDISDCPPMILDRLKHYFLTYKDLPGQTRKCEITDVYGIDVALEVIRRGIDDYRRKFYEFENALNRV